MPSKTGRVGGATRHLTEEQRFWLKVERAGPDECWAWVGATAPDGGGRFVSKGRQVPAYRVAWELHRGPLNEGLIVHHRCQNRNCVNPAHLEPVSLRQNLARKRLQAGMKQFIEEMGGVIAEQPPTARVTASLNERHSWWVEREAARRGTTAEEVVRHVIDSYLLNRFRQGERIFE